MGAQTLDQLARFASMRLKTRGLSDFLLIDEPLLPSLEFGNGRREGFWDGSLLHI
jgi:hypothetical protein